MLLSTNKLSHTHLNHNEQEEVRSKIRRISEKYTKIRIQNLCTLQIQDNNLKIITK